MAKRERIERLEIEGFYDTRRVFQRDYQKSCDQFRDDWKIILPSWRALRRIGDWRALWILLEKHITVKAYYPRGRWRQWRIDRGHIWDQASVPLFKNNLLEALIAAAIHDPGFSLHWYGEGDEGFDEANHIFLDMLRISKMNPVLRGIYYLAVRSIFGRAFFENNTRAFWHKKTAHYMEGRSVDSHF
jgi:hypothetical protein